eukprot:scaffold245147_cov43-Prasinocladus_malaysianus.AAC.1
MAAQRKHPGVLLVIEVGYKMCFYGVDAETASAVCNIMAFPSGNFLCASIPVPRLHIHVRRLVKAGHKVRAEPPHTLTARLNKKLSGRQ